MSRARSVFLSFIRSESSGGVILCLCSVLALIVANVPSLNHLSDFWSVPAGITVGSFSLEMSLSAWVNDGLMSIFFFMVGLEIKREVVVGELSRPKQAMLPIFAFSWLACRIGAAQLPSGIRWSQLLAIGMVGGIGFTMSLFIDNLAFSDSTMIDVGKAAIIITSVIAALLGYLAVSITCSSSRIKKQQP